MQDTYTDKVRVETLVQGLKSMQESINKARQLPVCRGKPRDPASCDLCRRSGWTLLLSMLSKSSRRLLGRQALEADFAATHADQDGEAQAGGATENELDTLQAVQPGTWFSPAFSSVAPSTYGCERTPSASSSTTSWCTSGSALYSHHLIHAVVF